jgi:hypothetical protein
MWAKIFWHCYTNPSFQVILIAIHRQLRAIAPYDLTILYCCYGQLTLDFWQWNPLSILTPLWLFKNKFRNLSKHICLLAFPFFIEISFGNHPCLLGSFPPILKALLASDQVNQLSWGGRSKVFGAVKVLKKPRHESPLSLINPWSADHNVQTPGIEKRANEVSFKSFAKFSLLQSHRHGQFFRPLYPILFSATMVRRCSITLPSLFPRPRSRRWDLTGRPLSSPASQPPDRSASPYLRRLGWPLCFVEL